MSGDEDAFESAADKICEGKVISESEAIEIGEALGNAIFEEERKD